MTTTLSRGASLVSWACQLTAAAILGQTLFFKFTGAPESRYIFSTLGVEPWGRIGTGVLELIAVGLLLYPRTPALGALLAVGLMGGAIFSHLTRLGIEVQGDHGLLFRLALTVMATTLVILVLRRRELPIIGPRL
jgi:putative oxidoreductase